MDAKITKKRLNILLSYDWIKIILLAVAAILVWSLIFTMTATRVTPAQNFTIFNYTGTSVTDRFNSYSSLKGKDVFSYEILEISTTDITTGKNYSETLLQTRTATEEGDALFAANVENEEVSYADPNGEAYHPTYLQQFLYSYYSIAAEMDKYLEEMEVYLDNYYNGDYKAGVADTAKIEQDFRARIKRFKDKRFKNETPIQKGLKDELTRIENYRKALVDFNGYLEDGYVELTETTLYLKNSSTGETLTLTGKYSINLCPDERMKNLNNDVYYYKTVKDENDEEKTVPTAEDINIVLLDFHNDKYAYSRWEGLCFVNYLIRTSLAAE